MARTLDVEAHATRRGEILDVAQGLVVSHGYEQMSIQDVLSGLGISKGALYHYFGSKQELLAGVVDRMADEARARLAAAIEDSDANALDRLVGMFDNLVSWKVRKRDELVALLRVWNSDGNALMRQRTRAGITDRVAPLFEHVVADGVADGTFTLPTAIGSGRVILSLVMDLNERLGELFFAHESGEADLHAVDEAVTAYTTALERLLGVTPGVISLVDLSTLHTWFAPQRPKNPRKR